MDPQRTTSRPEAAPDRASNLLVFADDWGRHPSSAQHLIRHLLPRHDVAWVNTIGMRPPRLDGKTLARAGEKCRSWGRPRRIDEPVPQRQPEVLSPPMWPWFRRRHDRVINRLLLERSLRPRMRQCHGPITAITTLPIVADLARTLPVDRWVYYCVDDFAVWPGLDAEPLRRMESELVPRVDQVIAASETLRSRLGTVRDDIELLTHGVDLEHWQMTTSAPAEDAALLQYPGPRIVFWGLVDRRLDREFLERLSADLTEGTILLIGPDDNPDPRLAELPRLKRIPAVPFERLPAVARQADLLVMPYADCPVTRMMQPLKMLEYLATGKPVVARGLPAVGPWRDCLDAVDTAEEFSRVVRQRLRTDLPDSQARARGRLREESWSAKAERFETLIFS